jgi:hypothetical protein
MIQNTKGHPQVARGLEGFDLSILRLNVEMGRLIEINLIPVNGLLLQDGQGLINDSLTIHHFEPNSNAKFKIQIEK